MVFQSLVTGAWWIETSLLFCVSRNSVPDAVADTPEPREAVAWTHPGRFVRDAADMA
jgi:hypothetical protein